ncbi:SLBB domain-containing protein, partial [Amylibacter sp.]|nr:SLBB domain-containing protein [Amylibacter sp.]
MNIRILRYLSFLILVSLCQPILAQSMSVEDIQALVGEDLSGFDTLVPKEDDTNQNLISQNRDIVNSTENTQLDLSIGEIQNSNAQSLSNRYFRALTGQNLNIYGSNEFNQQQDDNLLFFNTVGKDYQLASGDVIQVTITGLNASNNNYQVLKDGTITLEKETPFYVNNLNLNDVRNYIHNMILLNDASAEVFVRLNNARLVTVQISGNVKFPKTIAVPAYTPISRVIAFSGGISESGSLRNISLSQIGETTQIVDFYNFLQNPSPKTDPLIKNGARIFVPFKGPAIAVTGFVNNPGIYELPNNKSDISIKDLLSITGTSFLPSGAKLKISYFDSSGQIATRTAVKDDLVKEGEALQVDLIATRNLNISKVSGSVLKDFSIKTNTPLSIKEVLKNGAVLNLDTYRSFALIVGRDVQAINLQNALDNDDIILPLGSDLRLFSKKEYVNLVAQNPNSSLDPLISKIIASNVAEIYLDGVRIAYVPTGYNQDIYEVIRNFYTPNPKTVYELALIENNNNVNAFDLKKTMQNPNSQKLSKGDRLFIYESKFFNDLLLAITSDGNSNFQVPTTQIDSDGSIEAIMFQQQLEKKNNDYLDAVMNSQKILQQANLINIKLDGELFTYLPYTKDTSSSLILKKLRNRLPKLVSEFAVVQSIDVGKTPEIKNLNHQFKIKQGEEINFISSESYRFAIKSYEDLIETSLLSELKASNAVKVYY